MATASGKTSEVLKPPDTVRHCAYCLKEAIGMKKCTGCHKRAYCSRSCQKKDWSSKSNGQGHKNWCKLECCEEDIDWKVQEIPGKGLGIIALRDIPVLTRIMVDRCYTEAEARNRPQVMDLHPPNESFETKFVSNRLQTYSGGSVVCIRLSRVNHACVPNANHFDDPDFSVKVLFSEKDIKAGEEITISYATHRMTSLYKDPFDLQLRLLSWGIICPTDCACRDPATWQKVQEIEGLYRDRRVLLARGEFAEYYKCQKRILALRLELETGLVLYQNVYIALFKSNFTCLDDFFESCNYMRAALQIEKVLKPRKKNSKIEECLKPQSLMKRHHFVLNQGWKEVQCPHCLYSLYSLNANFEQH